MALRTSGHLLLGVVRIYSRKAKYLLADCNEAFVKIKMAFRPGMVDLPEEHREAAVNAITLPEVFHDFDTAMPELKYGCFDVDIEAQFSLNQSRAEEITMREDYGNITLVNNDDGFGDFDAEPPELMRNGLEQSLEQTNLLFSDGPSVDHLSLEKEKEPQPSTSGSQSSRSAMEIDAPIRDDGFGGNLGQDIIGGLFEGGLFDDAPMPGEVPVVDTSSIQTAEVANKPQEAEVNADSDDDMGDRYGGPPSVGGASSMDADSPPATPAEGVIAEPAVPEPLPMMPPPPEPPLSEPEVETQGATQDQTTLLANEEESFALAPVDASALRGFTKTKRKRKLIVDEVKNISGEEMKAQLSDTSDIVTTLDLAPPTKRLMHWKETGGVEKLFALPGRPIPARALSKNYQRHLTSRAAENYNFGSAGDDGEDELSLEQVKEVEVEQETGRRSTRKRKTVDTEETQPSKKIAAESVVEPLAEQTGIELQQFIAPTPLPVPQTPMSVAPLSVAPMSVGPPPTPQTLLPEESEQMDALSHLVAGIPPPGTPNLATPGTPAPLLVQPMTPGSVLVPPITPAPPTPLPLDAEIPQIPPEQVHSILEQHEQALGSVGPQPMEQSVGETSAPQNEVLPPMENMGYDLNNPLMANMGYDEHHPPAQTPGAISERGAATPWNEDYEFPNSVGPKLFEGPVWHAKDSKKVLLAYDWLCHAHRGQTQVEITIVPEEQQTDETYEQFEERVLNKRAGQMYHILKSKLERNEKLYLSEMTHRNNKKQVAQKFYTLLVLKKHCVLELNQDSSYDEILIQKGVKFDNPSL